MPDATGHDEMTATTFRQGINGIGKRCRTERLPVTHSTEIGQADGVAWDGGR